MGRTVLPSTVTIVGACTNLTDAGATLIVGIGTIVGGLIGFGLKWFLGSRTRWDADRHRLFNEFCVAANATWDCVYSDGSCDEDEFQAAYDKTRSAYAAAMFICRNTETSGALDQVNDALGKLYNTTVPAEMSEQDFLSADKAVHEAMGNFTNRGRQELGLPKLEVGAYEEWAEMWGPVTLRRLRVDAAVDAARPSGKESGA